MDIKNVRWLNDYGRSRIKMGSFVRTHKRLKRTLFVRTKHNMRILGLIPCIKLQNGT